MQVERIHYGSADRQRMKGYQIIGKSAGIDGTLAGEFCKWAPSHSSLEIAESQDEVDAWGLSYFPLGQTHVAIGRSIHGGPEYSGRGGLAVVTSALVMTRKQFAEYQFHAVDVARTAIALGYLTLPLNQEDVLDAARMTGKPISLPMPQSDFMDQTEALLPSHVTRWVARETCSLLRDGRKLMIVGPCDPLPVLTTLLDELKPAERSGISFACGIKFSNRRDFRLQFTFESMTAKLRKELDRAGITAIDLAQVLMESA
ncbi:MAG: hypothetical protein AAF802_06140 [Planctomycetota bacterium]